MFGCVKTDIWITYNLFDTLVEWRTRNAHTRLHRRYRNDSLALAPCKPFQWGHHKHLIIFTHKQNYCQRLLSSFEINGISSSSHSAEYAFVRFGYVIFFFLFTKNSDSVSGNNRNSSSSSINQSNCKRKRTKVQIFFTSFYFFSFILALVSSSTVARWVDGNGKKSGR